MPLYEVTLEQSYFGQQVINRWNYLSGIVPEGVSGAFKCSVGMGASPDTDIEPFGEDTILGILQIRQNPSCLFVQMIVKNLYSVTDFFTQAFPPNTAGTQASGEPVSPTQAVGFTSDRTRSDIRRAQKRFIGTTEAELNAGGILAPTSQTAWQTLGDAMADINVVPAGVGSVQFTPYVFGRQKYVVTESGKDAYKYYDTEAEQLEHIALITAFTLKPEVRTQATRQYGRGS